MTDDAGRTTLPDRSGMRDALRHAVQAREFEEPPLRESVAHFGAEARARGVPPERMLIAIKEAVNDRTLGEISDWWRAVLTDRFVRWGVEGYYRIDLTPGGGTAAVERSVTKATP